MVVGKKKFAYIVSATLTVGPFRFRKDAEAFQKKFSTIKGAKVSVIRKTVRGYSFSAALRFGAKNAKERNEAVSFFRKNMKGARVTVKKANG
jgi:ribosomal protein L22